MKTAIKAIIITPESYDEKKEFPIVYLLHGYSGNYRSWFENNPEMLAKLADKNELIFVCPDGDYNSWYLDSPVNDSIKYETYIATELISWVNSHYKTITVLNVFDCSKIGGCVRFQAPFREFSETKPPVHNPLSLFLGGRRVYPAIVANQS